MRPAFPRCRPALADQTLGQSMGPVLAESPDRNQPLEFFQRRQRWRRTFPIFASMLEGGLPPAPALVIRICSTEASTLKTPRPDLYSR